MNKSCDNCYWHKNHAPYKDRYCCVNIYEPEMKLCESHDFGCEHCKEIEFLSDELVYKDQALYEYDGDYYCELCLLNKIGAKSYPKTYDAYYDGKYIGNNLQGGDDAIEYLCVKHNLNISFID